MKEKVEGEASLFPSLSQLKACVRGVAIKLLPGLERIVIQVLAHQREFVQQIVGGVMM
ncbi:MAG: hypothetical protein M3N41_06215 [Acidobacteriota bacterium]|nr:hypothetical protein [Acidobacteriota bacterium]